MTRTPRCLSAVLALTLAACGQGNGNEQPADAGSGAYKLAIFGQALLTLHPGDVRSLQVTLAKDQVGPVSNAEIHFQLDDGDPAGAQLERDTVRTSVDGVAQVRFTAGQKSQFKLVATASAFGDARPVAFSVNVVPVRKLLQIVGAPQVQVQTDGENAQVTMYISSSVGLKVRLIDQDTGAPIAGEPIAFSMTSGMRSSFSSGQGTVVTGVDGSAQAFLLSTTQTEQFLVTAQSARGGVGAVTYAVRVQANATGQGCTSSQQCPAGQVCVSGSCQNDQGGGSCGSGGEGTCPFGYDCVNGQCVPPTQNTCDPNTNNCANGQFCDCGTPANANACQCKDVCPVCTAGTHCDPASHTCVDNGTPYPDVTGVWYTKHSYSIKDALPTLLQDVGKGIRVLDQALSGALGLPSWLQSIVDAIIKQYIPDWVKTTVRILDDVFTVLSTLRGEGAMRLTPDAAAGANHVKGTEVWTSLVFYWLPLCGDKIAGDPDQPLDCARFDIATTDSDNPAEPLQCKGQTVPAITVKAGPFAGVVSGSGTNNDQAPFRLTVNQRQVQLRMGKVVLVAIDLLLSYLTPYHCIDEATDCANGNACLVDCEAFGEWVSGYLGSTAGGLADSACQGVVTQAGKTVTDLLAKLAFDTDVLDFSGSAVIAVGTDTAACTSELNCAGQLGNDDFDQKLRAKDPTRDGAWTGSFFYRALKNMPGAWEAKREPLVP